MSDTMRLLARVANNQAEASAEDLEEIAGKQEDNLQSKKNIREVQRAYDKFTSDDIVEFDELVTLHEMRTWVGATDEAFWGTETVNEFEPGEMGVNPWKYDANKYSGEHGNNSHFYLDLSNSESEAGRKTKEAFDQIKTGLDDTLKDVEDDQSMVQFKIQMATSDLQNSENVRSQAEKRLEQQRKDLTRNWGG